jgi:hypothetical protein
LGFVWVVFFHIPQFFVYYFFTVRRVLKIAFARCFHYLVCFIFENFYQGAFSIYFCPESWFLPVSLTNTVLICALIFVLYVSISAIIEFSTPYSTCVTAFCFLGSKPSHLLSDSVHGMHVMMTNVLCSSLSSPFFPCRYICPHCWTKS